MRSDWVERVGELTDLIVSGNFINIDKVVKDLFDYQVIQKIAHKILKLGFSLRTLAEIASLKYIKENADIHWVSKVNIPVWGRILYQPQ